MDGRLLFNLFFTVLLPLRASFQDTRNCANNTITDFWHESTQSCGIDVRNALEVYNKIVRNEQIGDQFSEVLKYEIENTLNDVLVKQIIEMISNRTLATNKNSEIFEEEILYKSNLMLTRSVWEKALDELYTQSVDLQVIMEQVLSLNNARLKFSIIEYLWRNYDLKFKHNPKFLPVITFATTKLLRDGPSLSTQQAIKADTIVKVLPQQLLNIYQSWNYNVSLLNHRHGEYMFADSDIGPSPQQRYVFTFIPSPPSLKVKGRFKLHINSQGMAAIAIFPRGTTKFLKSDNDSIYYSLDGDSNPSQWWHILWPYEHLSGDEDQYVYLQHADNGKLLCATTEYDEHRRKLQIMSVKNYMMVESCQWKVIKRNR